MTDEQPKEVVETKEAEEEEPVPLLGEALVPLGDDGAQADGLAEELAASAASIALDAGDSAPQDDDGWVGALTAAYGSGAVPASLSVVILRGALSERVSLGDTTLDQEVIERASDGDLGAGMDVAEAAAKALGEGAMSGFVRLGAAVACSDAEWLFVSVGLASVAGIEGASVDAGVSRGAFSLSASRDSSQVEILTRDRPRRVWSRVWEGSGWGVTTGTWEGDTMREVLDDGDAGMVVSVPLPGSGWHTLVVGVEGDGFSGAIRVHREEEDDGLEEGGIEEGNRQKTEEEEEEERPPPAGAEPSLASTVPEEEAGFRGGDGAEAETEAEHVAERSKDAPGTAAVRRAPALRVSLDWDEAARPQLVSGAARQADDEPGLWLGQGPEVWVVESDGDETGFVTAVVLGTGHSEESAAATLPEGFAVVDANVAERIMELPGLEAPPEKPQQTIVFGVKYGPKQDALWDVALFLRKKSPSSTSSPPKKDDDQNASVPGTDDGEEEEEDNNNEDSKTVPGDDGYRCVSTAVLEGYDIEVVLEVCDSMAAAEAIETGGEGAAFVTHDVEEEFGEEEDLEGKEAEEDDDGRKGGGEKKENEEDDDDDMLKGGASLESLGHGMESDVLAHRGDAAMHEREAILEREKEELEALLAAEHTRRTELRKERSDLEAKLSQFFAERQARDAELGGGGGGPSVEAEGGGGGASVAIMTAADKDRRYREKIRELARAETRMETARDHATREGASLRESLAYKEAELDRLESLLRQIKEETLRTATQSVSGRRLPKSTVQELLDSEAEALERVKRVRVAHAHAEGEVKRLELQLRSRESVGEGLALIDFEQLKIENATVHEKIEDRDEELRKLRAKTTTTVQVLTHVKEKLQFVEREHSKLQDRHRRIEEDVASLRDSLARLKKQRAELRSANEDRRSARGFAHEDALAVDFERLKTGVAEMRSKVERAKQRHARLSADKRRALLESRRIHRATTFATTGASTLGGLSASRPGSTTLSPGGSSLY